MSNYLMMAPLLILALVGICVAFIKDSKGTAIVLTISALIIGAVLLFSYGLAKELGG